MTATLLNKTDRHTGKQVWAVEFDHTNGRRYRTSWSNYRNEACVWGRAIEAKGWCMSARPTPIQ